MGKALAPADKTPAAHPVLVTKHGFCVSAPRQFNTNNKRPEKPVIGRHGRRPYEAVRKIERNSGRATPWAPARVKVKLDPPKLTGC